MTAEIEAFFDRATFTVSYVVACPSTAKAAIVDPVLDFDAASGRTSTRSAEALVAHVERASLTVDWILETHVHADHLSAAHWLQQRLGARVAIGTHVSQVQAAFSALFGEAAAGPADGSQFDRLFDDGENFRIGELEATVLHTPGHTPACVTYVVGDAAFVGDTLFMPDFGTARCDFPGGDAATLYRSIRRILELPPETRLFMCHDYGPGGRDYAWSTTVAEQRERNVHVNEAVSESEFVEMRAARDATLGAPALLLPSVQVNVQAGRLPRAEPNGIAYLRIPLNAV